LLGLKIRTRVSQNSIIVVFAIFLLTVFCSLSLAVDAIKDISDYAIGSGDVVQVSVWQYEQFNTIATVGPDGTITVPLLGDIYVVGLTREEVKAEIVKQLARFVKEGAEATVSIVQFNSQKIHVFGQVANPRTISFVSPPSLLEVIIQSQFISDADLSAIRIIPERSSSRGVITVNIGDALQTGDTSKLPELHSGDTVYVPRKGMWDSSVPPDEPVQVDETGRPVAPTPVSEGVPREGFVLHFIGAQINMQSSLDFPEEPTLTEALLKAGSVSDSAALKYVRIIRVSPTIGDKIVDVDMEKYLQTGDASLLPRLYSGDIIYIPDITQEKIKDLSIIITGQVNKPGTYRVRESLNVLDAISLAGGLTNNADPEVIRIRREDANSYQEKILNIDEYFSEVGSIYTPEMVGPGHRIYVPAKRRAMRSIFSDVRTFAVFLVNLTVIYGFYRLIK